MTDDTLHLDLDVRGLAVIVVGGTGEALRRVGALRAAGAIVTVVAPHVVAAIEDLAQRGQIDWLPRDYLTSDLDDAWLVIAWVSQHCQPSSPPCWTGGEMPGHPWRA